MNKSELLNRIESKIVSKLRQQKPLLINADNGILHEILDLLDKDELQELLNLLDTDFMRVQLDKRFYGRQRIGTTTSIAELQRVLNSIAQEQFNVEEADLGLFGFLLPYLDTDTILEWASLLDAALIEEEEEALTEYNNGYQFMQTQ